jgi:hypothetical protein
METVALTLVLFLAVLLVLVPIAMAASSAMRRIRAQMHLRRMRQMWLDHNHRRTLTGISRPFTAVMAATTLPVTDRAAR